MSDADRADRIELEPSTDTPLHHDLRRPMFEPPPVRVIAIEDVHLPAAVGREEEMAAFYVGVLQFRPAMADRGAIAFEAENVRIVFDLAEPPLDRDNLAPTMIEVPSLRNLRETLLEHEIAYQMMQGLMPATEHVLVRDPAGNGLAIGGWRLFS